MDGFCQMCHTFPQSATEAGPAEGTGRVSEGGDVQRNRKLVKDGV